MKLLSIETSCDETAAAVLDIQGTIGNAQFSILGNALFSQIETHRQYGGVYPMMAKREHALNMIPLVEAALSEAELLDEQPHDLNEEELKLIDKLMKREHALGAKIINFLKRVETPDIDAITVATGPGLEPALWVGVNAAKALSLIWKKPLIPVNHLEGHLVSSLAKKIDDSSYVLRQQSFPAIALIVSGGHTELAVMHDWQKFEIIGATRDDAVGEAFDKVARMLELPYPGGPHITRLAQQARNENLELGQKLPRPMIDSGDFDFSFSGLKTAVLYAIKAWKKEHGELDENTIKKFAREFEEASLDVLTQKTKKAVDTYGAQTLIIGGGVSASTTLRTVFSNLIKKRLPNVHLAISEREISTDNAVMIGMAGAMRVRDARRPTGEHEDVVASGKLKLGS